MVRFWRTPSLNLAPKRSLEGWTILIQNCPISSGGDLTRSGNLQLKILKELSSMSTFGLYLRPTYSDVAKKLGIDEETVRVRVRQAERAGTVIRWQVEINPHVLGREATSVILNVDDPSKKDSIISQIKLIDEVVFIMDFYEKPLRIHFYHENDQDRERKLDLIKSICGDKNPTYWQLGFAPVSAKLKKTDWQIMKALRRDSLLSNLEVAKEIGVSARTVKRRVSFMTEARAIYTHTVGNIKRVPGMAYLFLVDCANERKKREIDEQIRSRLDNAIFEDTFNKQYSIYAAVFHNMGEADEMYRWIKSLEGAEKTRTYVIREMLSIRDWINNEIEKRLKESS